MSETSAFLLKFLHCSGCTFASSEFVKVISLTHLGVMRKDIAGRKESSFFCSLPHYPVVRVVGL